MNYILVRREDWEKCPGWKVDIDEEKELCLWLQDGRAADQGQGELGHDGPCGT